MAFVKPYTQQAADQLCLFLYGGARPKQTIKHVESRGQAANDCPSSSWSLRIIILYGFISRDPSGRSRGTVSEMRP